MISLLHPLGRAFWRVLWPHHGSWSWASAVPLYCVWANPPFPCQCGTRQTPEALVALSLVDSSKHGLDGHFYTLYDFHGVFH